MNNIAIAQKTAKIYKWQIESFYGAWFNNKSFSQPSPEDLFYKFAGNNGNVSISGSDGMGFDVKNRQIYSSSITRLLPPIFKKRLVFGIGAGVDHGLYNIYTIKGYRNKLEEIRKQYYNLNQGQVENVFLNSMDTTTIYRRYGYFAFVLKLKAIFRIYGSYKFNISSSTPIWYYMSKTNFSEFNNKKPRGIINKTSSTYLFNTLISTLSIYFTGEICTFKKSYMELEIGMSHLSFKQPAFLLGTNYNF